MSVPLVSVTPEHSLDKCYQLLEDNQIRRVPVVYEAGRICGIIALADIAERVSKADSGEVLQQVSAQTTSASNVG
jgi:CBS-domain-containing membrane protein